MKAPPYPNTTPSSPRWSRDLVGLAVVFGVLLFTMLGRAPLANPDEGRYAEIPREMRASGDWVAPRLNGVLYFEKPPLVYWMVAISQQVFGEDELASRAVPALFALGGILLTYAATRALRGRDSGLFAAVVLGTSLLYFAHARLLLLDMVVSVLMSATLFCFIVGVNQPPGRLRRWLFYGLYAGAALATLSKGLIGFLVTGAVMFSWLLLCNGWKRLFPMHLPTGALIFLAIAAPWHVLAAQRHPEWVQFYFLHEHWERFTSTVHGRDEPWWFFIPILVAGMFPWTGFLWSAARDACAGGWARRADNSTSWFFLIWAGFVFVFFSASGSKLTPYILPVAPALAALIGTWFALPPDDPTGAATAARRRRIGFNIFAFFCGLLAVGLLVAVFRPGILKEPGQAAALKAPAMAMAAVLLTGGILVPWLSRLRGWRIGFIGTAVTAGVFYTILGYATPGIPKPGTKDLAVAIGRVLRPGDRIFHYHSFYHDFVYYSHDTVGLIAYSDELEVQFLDPAERAARFIDEPTFRRQWDESGRMFIVARKRDAGPLLSDPTFRHHLIAESPDHYLISNQPGS